MKLCTGSEQAQVVYILKRLEAYLNPVFWLLTDPKVFLFLKTKLSKVIRVYNFSQTLKTITRKKNKKIIKKIFLKQVVYDKSTSILTKTHPDKQTLLTKTHPIADKSTPTQRKNTEKKQLWLYNCQCI